MPDPLTSTSKILMGKAKKKRPNPGTTIALNKKARFQYVLQERLEAGLVLEGWEVKSLRQSRIQFTESYVMLKDGEAFLFGALISPLLSASTHIKPDPTRTRKLLLHARELKHLIGSVERKGFTLVPTAMYWKNGRVKVEIALAKGKHTHDKRKTERDRDWQRDQRRILKGNR